MYISFLHNRSEGYLSGVLGKDCVTSQKNSGCGLLKDECYEFSLAIMSMNQGFNKVLSGHSR